VHELLWTEAIDGDIESRIRPYDRIKKKLFSAMAVGYQKGLVPWIVLHVQDRLDHMYRNSLSIHESERITQTHERERIVRAIPPIVVDSLDDVYVLAMAVDSATCHSCETHVAAPARPIDWNPYEYELAFRQAKHADLEAVLRFLHCCQSYFFGLMSPEKQLCLLLRAPGQVHQWPNVRRPHHLLAKES
jgi:hypothetical protein